MSSLANNCALPYGGKTGLDSLRNQAFSQACAVCSPISAIGGHFE
jgi:hypothetical protein